MAFGPSVTGTTELPTGTLDRVTTPVERQQAMVTVGITNAAPPQSGVGLASCATD